MVLREAVGISVLSTVSKVSFSGSSVWLAVVSWKTAARDCVGPLFVIGRAAVAKAGGGFVGTLWNCRETDRVAFSSSCPLSLWMVASGVANDFWHASRYIRASISSHTYSMSFITRTRQARKAYRLESPVTGGHRHYGDHLSSRLVDASTDSESIDTG